jgi:hypothetical protein
MEGFCGVGDIYKCHRIEGSWPDERTVIPCRQSNIFGGRTNSKEQSPSL